MSTPATSGEESIQSLEERAVLSTPATSGEESIQSLSLDQPGVVPGVVLSSALDSSMLSALATRERASGPAASAVASSAQPRDTPTVSAADAPGTAPAVMRCGAVCV
jgi:hypothetical protein